ncbi:MAG: phenylalanine--tRNA ligase subunit beta [Dehalococcoidia bacterium]
MKLLLSWLKEFVDVDISPLELKRLLLDATAEVESVDYIGGDWDPAFVRVGHVLAVEPHPNADRLRLATVDAGDGPQTVVCGAPNLAVGQKIAFATVGATLFDGHTGETAILKKNKIRGVESAGMVLSERELGLSEDHDGILVLPDDAPIGRPLVEQLGDVVFDITTWANRADLLGVHGLAREAAALTSRPLREPARSFTPSGPPIDSLLSVTVEDPLLCPRFTASVIENVTIGPSPAWMQERLARHGMRAINNVVDITNYVMLETGHPLHAFDYDLVRGKQLIIRNARPGERITTLDGVERELAPYMGLVCDAEGPSSIAGVMGGSISEISPSTRTILLEVANWHPGAIRRTSTHLHLRSEASSRFEKGIGPGVAMAALERALHLFEQLTGGRIAAGIIDVFPGEQPPRPVIIPDGRIEQVLGIEIPAAEVRRILTDLGFVVHHLPPNRFSVQPPPWRPDVQIADDLVEEVGRIYGYDKLPITFLRGALPQPEPNPFERMRERLRDVAAGLGFQEVITYSLTDMQSLVPFVAPDDPRRAQPLAVTNPVASQHRVLRTSLRGAVLSTFAANRRHEEGPLRLFEIGFEYLPTEADLPHERPILCAVLGGARTDRWGRPTAERIDFYDARGVVEALLESIGVPAMFAASEDKGLLPGHTAGIAVAGGPAGVVARVHPAAAAAFDVEEPVFLVELDLEALVPCLPERPDYAPPSRYPEVRQDIAILVSADVSAARVLDLVRSHRGKGISLSAAIFDDYRGPGIPDGQKSLAISLRYQASDRTLSDDEVGRVQGALLKRLERELGANLRGA